MKSRLIDLVNFGKINVLLEGFNKTTGLLTAILDLEGNVLSKSGWRQICTEFHRAHPETSKNCTISDTQLAGRLAEGEECHFYECLNGLADVAVPIVIHGEHIANLFSGQFFLDKPNREFFVEQAEKYKFDNTKYLDALDKVPIVSKEKVKTAMDFLLDMVQLIFEMGSQKLKQLKLNEAVEKSEERFRSMIEQSPLSMQMFTPNGMTAQVNRAYENLWGITFEDLKGYNILEDQQLVSHGIMPYIHRAFSGDAVSIPEMEYDTAKSLRTGKKSWVQSRIFSVKDDAGNIDKIILIHEDITERKKNEEEILRYSNQMKQMLESTLDGYILADAEGNILDVNPAYCGFIGYKPEELLAMNIQNLEVQLSPSEIKQRIAIMLRDGKVKFNSQHKAKNGEIHDLDVSIVVLQTETKPLVAAFVRDITENIKTKKELLLSNERFRSLFNDSPVPLWEEDFSGLMSVLNELKDTGISNFRTYFDNNPEELKVCVGKIKITDVNKATLNLHKAKSKDELLSNLDKLFTEKSFLVFKEEILVIAEGREEFESEGEVKTLTGELRYINLKFKIDTSTPNFKRALLATVDITERKQIEDAIQQKSKDLTTLLNISQTLTTTLNLDVVLQNIANRATRLIGLDTGAIYLINRQELFLGAATPPIYPAIPDVFRNAKLEDHPHINRSITTGLPIILPDIEKADLSPAEKAIVESRNMRSLLYVPLLIQNRAIGVLILGTQKETREFSEAEINLYRIMSGQAAFAIYNSQLFKEIKKLNEELENRVAERTRELSNSQVALLNLVEDLRQKSAELELSTKKLQAKNKELETFTYSVSHDLKAPLRGIDGYSKLLEELYSKNLNSEAQSFIENIRHGTEQMNQLIEDLLSYSRLERTNLSYIKLDIHKIITNIIDNFNDEIEEHKIKLNINVKSCDVYIDSDGITIAIRNIIENAIKFSKNQPIPEITIKTEQTKSTCKLIVKDNGIGFNMKFHDKIFEIFQRLHRIEDYPGTGIGLALVYKAMLRMGGSVWAESTQGNGSTFYLEIPKTKQS